MELLSFTSPETRRYLAPLHLQPTDRLRLQYAEEPAPHFIAEIFCDLQNGFRSNPSHNAVSKFPARIPERQVFALKPNAWNFGATDVTCAIISALWQPSQLDFADELSQQYYRLLSLESRAKEQVAEINATWREHVYTPTPHGFGPYKRAPQWVDKSHGDAYKCDADRALTKYQRACVDMAMRTEGFSFFKEQGCGKTAPSVAVIDNLIRGNDSGEPLRVLICCPNNLRSNWRNEIRDFSFYPQNGIVENDSVLAGIDTSIIRGGELSRMKLLIELFERKTALAHVAICGYDTLVNTWLAFQMVEWDLIILDESHYIANPKTKRWKYFKQLREKSRKRLILTGTPIRNSVFDLWSQWEFLGPGWSGFTTFEGFKRFHGVFDDNDGRNGGGYEKLVSVQNIAFLKERFARQAFLIRKSEALPNLPEKRYDTYEVEMTPAQATAYRKLATELLVEIESELDSGENNQLVITNMLTRLLRLAQITSGYIGLSAIVDEMTGDVIEPAKFLDFTPNPKTEACLEILREKEPNEKTIIWTCFTRNIRQITEAIRNEFGPQSCEMFFGGTSDIDRDRIVAAFNENRECRVFVGNPAAGGCGLNLLGYPPGRPYETDTNCNHHIYYSQNWSAVTRDQSESRSHRKGTRVDIRVTDLCVVDTIDEEIRERVADKRINAMEISDIRAVLSSIRNSLRNV